MLYSGANRTRFTFRIGQYRCAADHQRSSRCGGLGLDMRAYRTQGLFCVRFGNDGPHPRSRASVQPVYLSLLVSDVAQHGLQTEHLTFPTLVAGFV